MRKETKNWWEKAQEDLKAAKINYDNKVYYVASFLSQQAAEKALKALLLESGMKIPKVHDLVFLAEKAEAPQEIKEKCDKLTWVYIETRYPDYSEKNSHDKFTKDIVRKHILIAEEILVWVEEKI